MIADKVVLINILVLEAADNKVQEVQIQEALEVIALQAEVVIRKAVLVIKSLVQQRTVVITENLLQAILVQLTIVIKAVVQVGVILHLPEAVVIAHVLTQLLAEVRVAVATEGPEVQVVVDPEVAAAEVVGN